MLNDHDRSWQALARAVDVAIARGDLPAKSRTWGKVVLLEVMAGLIGMPISKLRNYYYREDPRFEPLLLDFTMGSAKGAVDVLRSLEFRAFSPLVWKRPADQLTTSRESLERTRTLLRLAERHMRAEVTPSHELRREVGNVAAEVMACALTFFDGKDRWDLLSEADTMFRNAMGPLMFDHEIDPRDAALFARFYENRATRCGLEWSNVWDDPTTSPTVGMDVVNLAIDELSQATAWQQRFGTTADVDENARVAQFAADKAKWYAKAGKFDEAREQVSKLGDAPDADNDRLLLKALEQITTNDLESALRTGSELAEKLAENGESLAPITAAMMVHNIELMRGNRPPLPEAVVDFLRESPVAASEHINLPRYRQRLAGLGYSEVLA